MDPLGPRGQTRTASVTLQQSPACLWRPAAPSGQRYTQAERSGEHCPRRMVPADLDVTVKDSTTRRPRPWGPQTGSEPRCQRPARDPIADHASTGGTVRTNKQSILQGLESRKVGRTGGAGDTPGHSAANDSGNIASCWISHKASQSWHLDAGGGLVHAVTGRDMLAAEVAAGPKCRHLELVPPVSVTPLRETRGHSPPQPLTPFPRTLTWPGPSAQKL